MNFYSDFVEDSTEFHNYEDLRKNFKLKVPENFNFAYDIVDRYAELEPNKTALVWCDDNDEERIFTSWELYRNFYVGYFHNFW